MYPLMAVTGAGDGSSVSTVLVLSQPLVSIVSCLSPKQVTQPNPKSRAEGSLYLPPDWLWKVLDVMLSPGDHYSHQEAKTESLQARSGVPATV